MKHYCRKTNIFLYICLALFAYSCSEENNFVKEQNHSKLKFEQKSFEEVLKIPIFNEAYRKITKSKTVFNKSAEARTALEDQYGFTIVENSPVRITTDENGSVFYTLLIERDVKENLKFENLMIQVKDDETAAAIFKYIMSEKGAKSQTGEYFFKDVVSSEFIDLNVEGKMFFSSNSDGDTCITTTQLMCNATWSGEPYDHIANYNCWVHAANYGLSSLYNTSSTVCYGDGGGGSTDGGTSSNNTGGHGASGGSGNGSLFITPIPCKTGNCIEADVIINDPCTKLKDKLDPTKANLKPIIIGLQGTLNQNGENGTSLLKTESGIYNNIPIPATSTSGIIGRAGFIFYGEIHTHPPQGPNESYPMFSWTDVARLLNLKQYAGAWNQSEIVMIGVFKDDLGEYQTYAIVFNTDSLTNNTVENILNNPEFNGCSNKEKCKDFDEQLGEKYENDNNYERGFLRQFYGFNISLYKANSSLTNWSRLKIDSMTAEITPTPCNN